MYQIPILVKGYSLCPHPAVISGIQKIQLLLSSLINKHLIIVDFSLDRVFDSWKSLLSYSRFWPGYLFLCLELDRRIEAFTNIVHLDDLSLLNGEDG